MTLLYYDPIFLEHETGTHPERAERVRQVIRHLERTGLDRRCARPSWRAIGRNRLLRIHGANYVEHIANFARQGGGRVEEDTVVSELSYDVATMAAGAVCDAVEQVISAKQHQALCLVRPPGHHALPDAAMGFCLFNNVAIGAKTAIEEFALERVLIVDWDVHHGNGTQETFWSDGRVGFLSIHRWPFYPGTGDKDETGSGDGLGATMNLPIAFGTPVADYHNQFHAALTALADRIRPQLVLISAGFDSHRDDPIGSLGLETPDFERLTQAVVDVANTYSGGKLVSVLEGGYNPGVLAGCAELHLQTLLNNDREHKIATPVIPLP